MLMSLERSIPNTRRIAWTGIPLWTGEDNWKEAYQTLARTMLILSRSAKQETAAHMLGASTVVHTNMTTANTYVH